MANDYSRIPKFNVGDVVALVVYSSPIDDTTTHIEEVVILDINRYLRNPERYKYKVFNLKTRKIIYADGSYIERYKVKYSLDSSAIRILYGQ